MTDSPDGGIPRRTRTGRPLAIAALGLVPAALACATPPPPHDLAPGEIETTVFLIGDAGEPDPRDIGPPLDSLAAQAAVAPERSIIVFLGDNVYPEGIPEEAAAEWADARRRLSSQGRAVPGGAPAVRRRGARHAPGAGRRAVRRARGHPQALVATLPGRRGRRRPRRRASRSYPRARRR